MKPSRSTAHTLVCSIALSNLMLHGAQIRPQSTWGCSTGKFGQTAVAGPGGQNPVKSCSSPISKECGQQERAGQRHAKHGRLARASSKGGALRWAYVSSGTGGDGTSTARLWSTRDRYEGTGSGAPASGRAVTARRRPDSGAPGTITGGPGAAPCLRSRRPHRNPRSPGSCSPR